MSCPDRETVRMRKARRIVPVSLWLTILVIPVVAGGTPEPSKPVASRMRQPVAMAVTDGGGTLLVANRRSGSISVVDASTRKLVAEYDIGRGLTDLADLPGGRYLLATDQAASQLLLIDSHDRIIRVVDRIDVSPDPLRLVVSADGALGVVSSRWSPRLTFVALAKRDVSDHGPRWRFSARPTCRFARKSWS